MILGKNCPRCRGDLSRVYDLGDSYLSCLQCGYVGYDAPAIAVAPAPSASAPRRRRRRGRAAAASVGSGHGGGDIRSRAFRARLRRDG